MRLTSSEEIGTELKEKDMLVFELANDDVYLSRCVTTGEGKERTPNPRWGYSIILHLIILNHLLLFRPPMMCANGCL